MKVIQVPPNRTLLLPKDLFKPADKVAVIREGRTLVIKKLEPSRLSSIAAHLTARGLPLREIVQEVRAYRRTRRTR